MVRVLITCVLTAVGGLLTGCSDADPERHEIVGLVTYKGEPVEEGVIDFEPQDGQATRDGATIRNGVYRIPHAKGLFTGRYRVSIIIGDGTTSNGNAGADIPKKRVATARGVERAPPEFNTRSTLLREVTATGRNTFDFAIP